MFFIHIPITLQKHKNKTSIAAQKNSELGRFFIIFIFN